MGEGRGEGRVYTVGFGAEVLKRKHAISKAIREGSSSDKTSKLRRCQGSLWRSMGLLLVLAIATALVVAFMVKEPEKLLDMELE